MEFLRSEYEISRWTRNACYALLHTTRPNKLAEWRRRQQPQDDAMSSALGKGSRLSYLPEDRHFHDTAFRCNEVISGPTCTDIRGITRLFVLCAAIPSPGLPPHPRRHAHVHTDPHRWAARSPGFIPVAARPAVLPG